MTFLFIRSTEPSLFSVGTLGPKGAELSSVALRSHAILGEVMSVRRKVKKLDGICVVAGPGSFTAVRTGVLIANLIARLDRIPLYGIAAAQAQDLDGLYRDLAAGAVPTSGYVAPTYTSEPNITLKTT